MTEEITEIIAGILEVDADGIDPDCDLMEALGADSIDIVETIAEIEDQKGIIIPEDVIPDLRCIRDINECVKSLINGKE